MQEFIFPTIDDPDDFQVKTCLHSVSYLGVWRGQTPLTVDEFLEKAKELGYEGVMLVAKRPHVSPHDYDKADRVRLKTKIESLGLTLVGLAGEPAPGYGVSLAVQNHHDIALHHDIIM